MSTPSTRAFLLLGTNIKPSIHLKAAVRQLRHRATVAGISTVYQSKPVGNEDQPDFLNVAVELITEQSSRDIRTLCKSIENELGRDRSGPKNSPRKIDLDPILYGTDVINNEHQTLPDPDLLRFAHIAVPVAELAPDLVHPTEQKTLRKISETIPNRDELTPRPDVLLNG